MKNISADEWPEFSAQLDAALDLEESERARWLTELAARNPSLAERIGQVLRAAQVQGYAEFLAAPCVTEVDEASATLAGHRARMHRGR
jgi:hypothetical protein